MDLRRYGDVVAFLEAAEPFLVVREAEHNLILGVTSNLRAAPDEFTGAPYLATVLANGRVVAAAMQTPPSISSCPRSTTRAPSPPSLTTSSIATCREPSVRSSMCEHSSTLASHVAALPPAAPSQSGSSA